MRMVLPRQVTVNFTFHFQQIIRMKQLLPVIDMGKFVAIVKAKQLFPGSRIITTATLDIPVPHTLITAFKGKAPALLRFFKRIFSYFLFRNICCGKQNRMDLTFLVAYRLKFTLVKDWLAIRKILRTI